MHKIKNFITLVETRIYQLTAVAQTAIPTGSDPDASVGFLVNSALMGVSSTVLTESSPSQLLRASATVALAAGDTIALGMQNSEVNGGVLPHAQLQGASAKWIVQKLD